MSTLHLLQTSLEVLLVAAVLLAIHYEPVLAKWEEKQKRKVLRALKERRKFRGENQNV